MVLPSLPRLHAVTDDRLLARADFGELARRVLAAGGGWLALHLRGRATSGARLYELATGLRTHATAAGALVLANDRVDVACAAELDGVHLGWASLPPDLARKLLPAERWVGLSVHDIERAQAAAEHVDYLVVGTVFATSSHPDRPGAGPEVVARVHAAASLPLLAVGGVTPERVPEVLAAGACGVAVLSGIWGASDPATAVEAYLRQLPAGFAAPAHGGNRKV